MSRMDLSTYDLFLRLGTTPRTRSARADQLFRRLRSEEEQEIMDSIAKAPTRLALRKSASQKPSK
ncbi:MAG TPA: hypothetical protein PK585_07865 [Amphiplicatus sp.]|nr:hypothetical protein [Amphiplicatus sp.]